MRALHNFSFNKGKELVAPFPENCTPEFWKGCSFMGQVASLTGASRNLVQAGYWDVEFKEQHYVTMTVRNIVSLHVETTRQFRNG
jgi:hypothetical protein